MNSRDHPIGEVAGRIEARLASNEGFDAALAPNSQAIEQMIDAAFWASLLNEEGQAPRISLAFTAPAESANPLMFQQPLALVPEVLARLSPAAGQPGVHLGVWSERGQLHVWGMTQELPLRCFVLQVVRPGLVVAKYKRTTHFAKLSNIAVLEGPHVRFLEQDMVSADVSPAFTSLMRFFDTGGDKEYDNVMVWLAVSMMRHSRGGTMLVVKHDDVAWHRPLVNPVSYCVDPPYSGIGELVKNWARTGENVDSPELLNRVSALANLTAVDGAAVMTDHFELRAFGAKIASDAAPVAKVLLIEPYENAVSAVVPVSQLGGTRHLSAAQYVQGSPNSLAMVASQDGRFTLLSWSAEHRMVQAHRLEALLI